MTVKQVIVMRTKFPHPSGNGFITPRKGKMIAQACHASMMFLADKFKHSSESVSQFSRGTLTFKEQQWLSGNFTKICVSVDSEEELLEIQQKAIDSDLVSNLITDAGLTEFKGVPTRTCIAIGPDEAEKIDAITGHLKLL